VPGLCSCEDDCELAGSCCEDRLAECAPPEPTCVDTPAQRERSAFLMDSTGTEPLRDGERLHFWDDAEARIAYTRVLVVGDPTNVTRIFFSAHGDHATDRSQANFAQLMAQELGERTPAGEGAFIAFPISTAGRWPGFDGGKNGWVLFNMFQGLKQLGGNNCDVRFEQFAHSGGGRLNHALMKFVASDYDSSPEVRAFVDNNFRGIHDGESIGYSRRNNTQAYIDILTRFTQISATFTAGPRDGKMDYVYSDSHLPISRVFGGELQNHKRLSLDGGRIRFVPVKSHDAAWWDGQYEGFFGRPRVGWVDSEEDPVYAQASLIHGSRVRRSTFGGSGRVAIIYGDPGATAEQVKSVAGQLIDDVLAKVGCSDVFAVYASDEQELSVANDRIGSKLAELRSRDGLGGLDILLIAPAGVARPSEQALRDYVRRPGQPDPRLYFYSLGGDTPLPPLPELIEALGVDLDGRCEPFRDNCP
jgi:hypothetical protein